MANFYSSTLQKGSKGDEVKKWQEFLNTQGYGLGVDGDFGDKTDAATRDYQQKNGLGVDGIVGEKTWGKAGFLNLNTPITAPTATPSYTYTPFEYKEFAESDETKGAKDNLSSANDALTNLGDFNWVDQGKLDEYANKYENRDKFSYDFNTDALYQQYKDKYIKQAKMASADVMGQASAMTGGYGSSYAQTVGNQAYQSSLEQLNDVIPELYQLAYDKYNQEGQDMLNMISLLRGERDFAYGQYNDQYNKLADNRDYWSNMYNNLYNRDYTQYSSDRTFEQTNHNTAEGYKYQADRDAVTDAQWQAQFDEGKRQYEQNLAFQKQQYEDSKYANAGGQYKVTTDKNGKPVVTPDVDETIKSQQASSIPSNVINGVQNYTTKEGQVDYLAKQVAEGKISEEQAYQILDEHGVVPLTERSWEMVDDGGLNWFWGVDNDAVVRDENGNKYTLKELKKELEKTMTSKEAKNYIKQLQKQLGI
jgi:peptidoglycan hydrolase-like protein with peptidoglycan-binding domain